MVSNVKLASAVRGPQAAEAWGRGTRAAASNPLFLERLSLAFGLLAYAAALAAAWLAILRFVPDQLRLSLLRHSLALNDIHHKVVDYGLLLFALLPAALCIECWFVGWRASSARALLLQPTASSRTDITYFLLGQPHLTNALSRVMTLGATMLSGAWLHDRLSAALGVPLVLIPPTTPFLLQVVGYFGVYSLCDYWCHRLDHSRYFWPLHRYHHAAAEFYVVTASREHPAAFTGIVLVNMPMAILGASAEAMIYVNLVVLGLGFLIHSRIDSNWGWIGRWIIQSPNHHRLHHVLDISTTPVGHFSMAPIWDHLFGTWRGECDQSLVIGVDTEYRHGLWLAPDILRDYRDFWKGLLGRPGAEASG